MTASHGHDRSASCWGAATAAYQIEGAAHDGRPRRVDLGHASAARPGSVANGDTGDRGLRPLPPLAARTST